MTKTRKVLITSGGVAAGLTIIALLCAIAVLRSDWFREQIRLRFISEVERATGGRAEIGEVSFNWERLQAEVQYFVLHGKEGAGEPPLFQARSVGIGLKIVSLLDRDIDILSLVLVEPRARVVVYADGRTNLPQPRVALRPGKPLEQFLSLAVQELRIEKGILEVNERRIPLDIRGENLAAKLFYQVEGPCYSGDVSFRQLHLISPSAAIPPLDADLTLSLEGNRLSVRAAKFATKGSAGQGTATVENLISPRVSASFDAQVALDELMAAVKSPVAGKGRMRLAGTFSSSGIADYLMTARASGAGLSAQYQGVRLRDVKLVSDVELRPKLLALHKLQLSGLGGTFNGEVTLEQFRRFHVTGETQGLSIPELARLRGVEAKGWNGTISGPVEIEGELVANQARRLKATGDFTVIASAKDHPVEGAVSVAFNQAAGTLEFRNSRLSTSATRLQFDGALEKSIRVTAESTDLGDALMAASLVDPKAPQSLPVSLKNGAVKFSGVVAGKLEDPRISGHVSASNVAYEGRLIERLEADVAVASSDLQTRKLVVDWRGARFEGEARIGLKNWRPEKTSEVTSSGSVRGLSVETALSETGNKIPASGIVSGTFQMAGSIGAPRISGSLEVGQSVLYGEKLDQTRVGFRYEDRVLRLDPILVGAGQGRVQGSVAFKHDPENFKTGALSFELAAKNFRISQARKIAGFPEEVDGNAEVQVKGEASVKDAKLLLNQLQGRAAFRNVTVNKKSAGELQVTAETQGDLMVISADGKGAGTHFSAQARARLRDNYPVQGEASFDKIALSTLWPWLTAPGAKAPPAEVVAQGKMTFSGNALDQASWKARLELPSVEVQPEAGPNSGTLALHSVGPVVLALSRKQAVIESARFAGTGTNLEGTGRITFGTNFDVRVRGGINLEILRNFDRNVTSAGNADLDISVLGSLARPEIYGQLELKKASLSFRGVPNGIDGANGRIQLFRDRVFIDNLSATTGGGTVSLNGSIGFGGDRPIYQLKAVAKQVRVRYPEGVSTTFDAAVDLTGSPSRSLLSGTAVVSRWGTAANIDFASLLSRPSQPMFAPAGQNELLRAMQLDIKVETAQNARFETSLTRGIQAEADLNVRGTPYKPILLGRVLINQGEINFLGNRYRISRGEISFVNPVKLEPVLDLDLYTRVQGVDVTMNFTGPLDNRLNLTYRSDPPLPVNEIIALLAVGRAPTSDPTLLSKQTERDQSWQQIGASTLVGRAFETLDAGRLQRFFGVSRIKIDPKLTGVGNVPEAQLTVEQQVSTDITFTYVTSLAQQQQQLIRVEWNVSRLWSVVAVRDENGLFGIEFQYRKQFK